MTADTVGGVWTYAMDLSRGLSEHGISVLLATMGESLSSEQAGEARSIPNLQVFESEYRLEWMQDPWDDVGKAGEWLLGIERRIRPDIIHLNNYAHGGLPWNAPQLIVGHSCVLSWWRAVFGSDCDDDWETYRDAVARGLRAARCLVAPSRAMLQALEVGYGRVRHGHVIYNGRTSSFFEPGIKEPFILSAGRLWDKAKNIRLLESVAGSLPWPVRIAGQSHEPGTEEETGFRNIEYLGRLPPAELAKVYGRAAIYALPAKYEPFGLSVLEAALSGCVLVLGDIGSLREIWGSAAVYVNPEDGNTLSGTLRELIADPGLRERLAKRAQLRAREYSVRKMTEEYMQVYRSLKSQDDCATGILPMTAERGC